MMREKVGSLILLFGALIVAGSAHAVPVSCPSGTGLPCTASAGDTLFGGLVLPASGNDTEGAVEAAVTSALSLSALLDLVLYGKSDEDPALFSFTNLNGSELTDSNTGGWIVLDGTPIAYVSIKGGTGFVVYSAGGASSGTFSTLGLVNNGSQEPTVSHLSFWTGDEAVVPEPASIMLLLGALGAGAAYRKKIVA